MNLVIDLGNTLSKVFFFEKEKIVASSSFENIDFLLPFLKKKTEAKAAILSSVVNHPPEITQYLKTNFYFVELNSTTPLPIENLYRTPETLGKDRLAAVVGANNQFKNRDVLVIDAGTCIKYDFVNAENQYLGGAISPGIDMRFKGLNTFTDKLPLLTLQNFDKLIGESTEESILSGVQNGVIAEVKGIINMYEQKFTGLKTILTGGDFNFFAKALKNSIFADPFLVAKGLNVILDYNAGK